MPRPRRVIHFHLSRDAEPWEGEARKGKGPGGGEWTAGSGGGGGAAGSGQASAPAGLHIHVHPPAPASEAPSAVPGYAGGTHVSGRLPMGGEPGPGHSEHGAPQPHAASTLQARLREQYDTVPKTKGDSAGGAAALYEKFADTSVTAEKLMESLSPDERDEITGLRARATALHDQNGDTKMMNAGVHGGAFSAARRHMQNNLIINGARGKPGLLSPEAIRRATPPEGQKPTFTMLGGRGGSGKGSLEGLVYDPSHSLVLDADTIKAMLPEFEGWNAGHVHEESSDVLERVLEVARRKKLNVVFDATMKSRKGVMEKLNTFKDAGYDIEAHYMFAPPQLAAQRAIQRYFSPGKKGFDPKARGRLVDPAIILSNTENEKNFDEATKFAKNWSLWENTGSEPKLVSHGGG